MPPQSSPTYGCPAGPAAVHCTWFTEAYPELAVLTESTAQLLSHKSHPSSPSLTPQETPLLFSSAKSIASTQCFSPEISMLSTWGHTET